MDYYSFFCRLKEEDERNEFRKIDNVSSIPGIVLPDLYKYIDPVQVEMEINDGIVKLIPLKALADINEEYRDLKADCVFAVCNGDPVYMKNSKVYTCVHGSSRLIEEEIADSIESYLELAII